MKRKPSHLLGCVLVALSCVVSTLHPSFVSAEGTDATENSSSSPYDDFEPFCADLAAPLPYRGQENLTKEKRGESSRSKREGKETVLIDTLLDWCVDDKECKEIYHQSYRKNATIFKQLLAPQMEPFRLGTESPDLHYLTRELLCEGKSAHDISKILWLQRMKTDIGHSAPQCDVNHRLVYDETNMVFQCACKADKACDDDDLFDLIPFYVVVALVLLLVILGVSSHVVRTFLVWRTLENANKRAKELERSDGGNDNNNNNNNDNKRTRELERSDGSNGNYYNNKKASHNYLLTVLEHVMG